MDKRCRNAFDTLCMSEEKKNRSLRISVKNVKEKNAPVSENRSGSMYSGGGCSDGWNCGREDISVCYVFEKGSDACGISDIRQCR